jgi:glycerophosphoryl diester phosphodiesterase
VSRKRLLVAIVVSLVGILAVAAMHEVEARKPYEGWPTNFAHRGASEKAPENTLEAFRLAVEDGAGGLELDVHMTSDGRVAVIHDDSVDRTTDGQDLVRNITLREVQSLDGGYRFTPDEGGTYPYRGRGVRVPELGEVLREFPDQWVNIDIKEARPGVEAAVLQTVTEAGAGDRVLVVSKISSVLQRFRELSEGSVSTGASRREIEK